MAEPLSRAETSAFAPGGRRFSGTDRRAPLRAALMRSGQFDAEQTAGRFYPVACVALEVTQRCNLDCTLCYLSDSAEMAHDVPLQVLFNRIGMIESHYGSRTSIQITGGDPTLRSIADLEALCREIRRRGMRSCLMTNGIRASSDLLARLAVAGLNDVAFHVDLTQERRGYPTEVSLNAVREEYMARVGSLPLRVMFNTTVFDGNLAEIPALARFFRDHAAEIALASFQLQANTGRGVPRKRGPAITQASVMAAMAQGVATPIDFDVAAVGHARCNRYASILVAGDQAVSALGDAALFSEIFPALERVERGRDAYLDLRRTALRLALARPWLALRTFRHGLYLIWRLRTGLLASRGRVHRLGILVHSFMDSGHLERDRCDSCIFMAATEDGPLCMCVHNARRDHYLSAPARLAGPDGPSWWSAATGLVTDRPRRADFGRPPFKHLKGRLRTLADRKRRLTSEAS